MNRYLAGKTVLITGASSGLGESLAHACAEEKAHLVLIARNLEKLEELAGRIEASYEVNVSVYKADLTEFANLDALSKKNP